jgi:Uma2 family endonuclease
MAVPLPKLTVEEYLAIERQAEYKSEYHRGEMFAMAGASLNHNRLCSRIIVSLAGRLAGSGCEILTSDMRVQTASDTDDALYTYPDVTIVCGKPVLTDGQRDVLANPSVIFEVLSKSTEAKDRSFKFQQYKRITSLEEYVLVSQWEPLVECYSRRPGAAWTDYSEARGMEAKLVLKSLGVEIPLAELYRDVEFEADKAG